MFQSRPYTPSHRRNDSADSDATVLSEPGTCPLKFSSPNNKVAFYTSVPPTSATVAPRVPHRPPPLTLAKSAANINNINGTRAQTDLLSAMINHYYNDYPSTKTAFSEETEIASGTGTSSATSEVASDWESPLLSPTTTVYDDFEDMKLDPVTSTESNDLSLLSKEIILPISYTPEQLLHIANSPLCGIDRGTLKALQRDFGEIVMNRPRRKGLAKAKPNWKVSSVNSNGNSNGCESLAAAASPGVSLSSPIRGTEFTAIGKKAEGVIARMENMDRDPAAHARHSPTKENDETSGRPLTRERLNKSWCAQQQQRRGPVRATQAQSSKKSPKTEDNWRRRSTNPVDAQKL